MTHRARHGAGAGVTSRMTSDGNAQDRPWLRSIPRRRCGNWQTSTDPLASLQAWRQEYAGLAAAPASRTAAGMRIYVRSRSAHGSDGRPGRREFGCGFVRSRRRRSRSRDGDHRADRRRRSRQGLFGALVAAPVCRTARDRKAEVSARIPMLMIGGTAGLMSPHFTLFVNKPAGRTPATGEPRLAIGVTSTRTLLPEEYGTVGQIELVADGVRASNDGRRHQVCRRRRLRQDEMPADDRAANGGCGRSRTQTRSLQSAGRISMCRGASALGAALALGEIPASEISDAIVGRRPDLYTERGSASSGSEQVAVRDRRARQRRGRARRLRRGERRHAEISSTSTERGRRFEPRGPAAGRRDPRSGGQAEGRGRVRQRRRRLSCRTAPAAVTRCTRIFLAQFSGHVAKAVAHANVSAIVQDTLVLGNAGAEHQGKPGSNLVCVIANHG